MYISASVNSLSQQLEEAKNTLTYTIHLPYQIDSIRSISESKETYSEKIDIITRYMHKSCLPLFTSTFVEESDIYTNSGQHGEYLQSFEKSLNSSLSGNWLFFGANRPDSTKQNPPGPLHILGTSQYYSILSDMLTHHCLLATYDKLHDIIFQNIEVNCYGISRHFNCCGFHYSKKKQGFTISATSDNHFIFNDGKEKSSYSVVDSDIASNNASNNYPASFLNLKNTLSKYTKYQKIASQIIPSDADQSGKCKNVTIPLSLLPLLQQLRGRGKELSNVFKLCNGGEPLRPSDIKKFMESIHLIQQKPIKLTANVLEPHMTNVDILYYKYKLEQLFPFDLIYCLTKNIMFFDKRLNQRICDDSTLIDVITSIVNFPNTFSRPFLIQMAFDSCSDFLQLDSSLLSERIQSPDKIVYINKRPPLKTDSHAFLSQWRYCYNNFINYMAELIFPIYESYFFVMMYDVFSNPQKSVAENVLEMYTELGDYLSTEKVFKAISYNSYQEKIMKRCNSEVGNKNLETDDFITSDYSNANLQTSTLGKVCLSVYNHLPEPTPPLISRDYLYKNFPRTKECFLASCTAELL